MIHFRFLWTLILLVLLLLAGGVQAHETLPYEPTPEEIRQITPALPGAVEFGKALSEILVKGLTGTEQDLLEQIGLHLSYTEQINKGWITQAGPHTAEFHRWQAEKKLLDFLNRYSAIQVIDYSHPQSAPPSESLILDQQVNVLLFRVRVSEGSDEFRSQDLSLVQELNHEARTLRVAPRGTTWVMLHLSEVPQGQTDLNFPVRRDGDPEASHWHTLSMKCAPWGQLSFTSQDENGEVVPVLLRLTAKPSGKLWEPADAANLIPMTNAVTGLPIYGPGRGYMIHTPRDYAGRYWAVDGKFEMALPPGEWELHLLHGPEHLPVHESFRIESGKWTHRTISVQRWIDMPARGWYSGDDHVHARLISSEDADHLMQFTLAADVHVANILEMGDWMRTFYVQRGFGPEFHVQHGNHWLIPGQEDPRSILGHAIGLNLTGLARDLNKYCLNDWIAGEIHAQGGLYGHTHVGENACLVHREMALFTPLDIVDFNSILQIRLGTELFYDFLNMGFRMTASAGSDTPYGGTIGVVRLYACTGNPERLVPQEWFDALKAGKTFVTNGPMLDFTVNGSLPGTELVFNGDETVTAKASAWGAPGHTAPQKLELIRFGQPIAAAISDDIQNATLETETTIPVGHGFWICAHAVGFNGTEALSTPVYVTRQGFRFWDPDQADRLIDKQLKVLDEIQAAIEEAQHLYQGNPADYWNRWPSEQAGEVMKRLEKARTIYTGLSQKLADEKEQR